MTQSTPASLLDTDRILSLFEPDGVLAASLKGFESREAQRQMVQDIIGAYNENRIALIEAGTGTGKSLAYLLPAVCWALENKQRTVISTNTINLQEQLLFKDFPLLTRALQVELKAVLVKGMSNYLCLRKHQDSMEELQLLDVFEAEELQQIDVWKNRTQDGTRASLPMVPSWNTWEKVMAETDACTGRACPHYSDCFFFKARAHAANAQILVVNHHLLFADLAARAEANDYEETAILPPYEHVIIDEAHNIEETATSFFATQVSHLKSSRLLHRLGSEAPGKTAGKLPLLRKKIEDLYGKSPENREVQSILQRLSTELPAMQQVCKNNLNQAFHGLMQMARQLSPVPQFGVDVERTGRKLRLKEQELENILWGQGVLPQVNQLCTELDRFSQSIEALLKDLGAVDDDRLREQAQSLRIDAGALKGRLMVLSQDLSGFTQEEQSESQVRWVENTPTRAFNHVNLVHADLDITTALVNRLFKKFPTVILCSATLSTNQDFNFIRKRFGLTPELLGDRVVTEAIYPSPFDYEKQALLAVANDLPDPNHPSFLTEASQAIWKLLQASRGNAFVLFTSYTALRTCHQQLQALAKDSYISFLKQGDDSRKQLLDTFRNTEHSVLLGTDSFWEGVDVAGEALRQVIIVKLPFRVPSEPIIEARTELIRKEGGKPFFDYSLPNAIVKFKQGFGRLIRHRRDRGCIVCLDNRLLNKGYGAQFLNSLPNCPKLFAGVNGIAREMRQFYRDTEHLVKNK